MIFPRIAAAFAMLALSFTAAQAGPLIEPRIDGAALFSLDAEVLIDSDSDLLFVSGLVDVFDDGQGGALTPPNDFTITGFPSGALTGDLELNVFENPLDADAMLFGRSVSIAAPFDSGTIEIGFEVVADATGLFGGVVRVLLLEGVDPFPNSPLTSVFTAEGASAEITAASVVPVPFTAPLLLSALGAVVFVARRRR